MQQQKNSAKRFLQSKGIRPTNPRVKIFEYLRDVNNHATADGIYQGLVEELPSLSKTTVYNVLRVLIESKMVRAVNIEEGEMRYDAIMTQHGHFKCEKCGAIYDFPVNIEKLTVKGLERFEICEKDVLFRGICPPCLTEHGERK